MCQVNCTRESRQKDLSGCSAVASKVDEDVYFIVHHLLHHLLGASATYVLHLVYRNLLWRQKRPAIESKKTYYRGKRVLLRSPCTRQPESAFCRARRWRGPETWQWCLGFRVSGFGFRVQCLGFRRGDGVNLATMCVDSRSGLT
jgi:hypothetical protein